MKHFLFPVMILVLFSCRRDEKEYVKMIVGDTTGLVVTEHDTLIDALQAGWDNKHFCNLNLDEYAGSDIRVTSEEYSIDYPVGMTYRVYIEILNDQFSFAEIQGSGVNYESIEIYYDFFGTFPRKTYERRNSCEPIQNPNEDTSLVDTSFGAAQYFTAGVELIDFLYWDNYLYRVDLVKTPYEYKEYNFNVEGDSLIGNYMIYPGICNSLPENEVFYLVFKKSFGTKTDYGWIELKISDKNAVYISRSAITK